MGIFIIFFVVILVTVFGVFLLATRNSKQENTTLNRAQKILGAGEESSPVDDAIFSDIKHEQSKKLVNLSSTMLGKHIETLMSQGAIRLTVPAFFGISFGLALGGFLLGLVFFQDVSMETLLLSVGGVIPYFYVKIKRDKRLQAFDKALPDAIDMITRSLKAGRSILATYEVVGTQAMEPVRTEFAVLAGQIRLNLDQKDALMQLIDRVPTQDLRFLVTAILVQKESGGNLAPTLERATNTIRERVRILGELRTKTANARLSSTILICLPIVLGFGYRAISPEMFNMLLTDPLGRYMLTYAVVSSIAGALIIRMIAKQEV